ncbi:hypothetical protein DMX02_00645 [Pseudomonas jessenii]|nr:hypothetical protein DMX02_00645 [Pseudomonas jessenii]
MRPSCGSEAKTADSGIQGFWFRFCVAWADAFASKLAPTGDSVHNANSMWERACSRKGRHRH